MTIRRSVDLHTHSDASDGSLPAAEVVRLAERQRLAAIALTDHDTTAAVPAARQEARQYPQLKFVAGIEISAMFSHGTLHILGLGIDETHAEFQRVIAELQEARRQRNPRMIAKLQAMGLAVGMDDVEAAMDQYQAEKTVGAAAQRIIGRLHIALALLKKGYVHSRQQAFDRYLGEGRPAYVDKERLRPRDAIAAIRAAGGIAVLAHPAQLKFQNFAQMDRIVRDLVHAGLEGIEAYHSDHNPALTRMCLDLARRLGLMVSGGSDFHGCGKPHVQLGHPRVPLAVVDERFRQRLGM